jgi:hypothetical protein
MRAHVRRNPDGTSTLILVAAVLASLYLFQDKLKIGGPTTLPFPKPNPGGDNQWGPANGGADTFNLNLGESWWRPEFPAAFSAHIGVGHIGTGGTFACVLWGRNPGILGLGASDPVSLAQQNFTVSNDADWTGYGIDFRGVGGGKLLGLVQANVWAAIVGLGGEQYTQANINVTS